MAVDGGAGNTISFSEIQTYYGGSNPISISEYYRGGSEVPGTSTVVAANSDSGTTSATSGSVAAVVTNDSTSATINGGFSQAGTTFTIDTGTAGGSTTTLTVFCSSGSTGGYTIKQNGSTIGSVGEGQTVNLTVNDGGNIAITQSFGDPQAGSYNYTRLTRVYDMTLTNNTGQTLNLTSSPWGSDSSFTNGEVKSVNNSSSNSWSWSHPAVTGDFNTNVPASGTINMDVFNAPGSATP